MGGHLLNAELIAVGTELLLGQIANTHAQFLSAELAGIGMPLFYHTAVGDNRERLAAVLRTALERSDVIVCTGGLGPTDDDITRETVAGVCNLPLLYSETAFAEHVKPFFDRMGKPIVQSNHRQAQRVGNAEFLPNPRGTAPGQYVRCGKAHLFLLPGPPLEMRPMFLESVLPRLVGIAGSGAIVSRVLRLYGVGESELGERVRDLLGGDNPTVAPLAAEGEVSLRVTARASTEAAARALLGPVESELLRRLEGAVYGFDGDSLAGVVFRELSQRAERVAFAESCTGGLLSSMMVDIPGSSRVFLGGIVAYDNGVKSGLLGVSETTLAADGAVSEAAAREMAQGVRERLGASYGVGVTGIAGPGGGTEDKPVGLVYISVADSFGTSVIRRVFVGDRTQVRVRAAKSALHALLSRMRDGAKPAVLPYESETKEK